LQAVQGGEVHVGCRQERREEGVHLFYVCAPPVRVGIVCAPDGLL
jgi:hypothetical protein